MLFLGKNVFFNNHGDFGYFKFFDFQLYVGCFVTLAHVLRIRTGDFRGSFPAAVGNVFSSRLVL